MKGLLSIALFLNLVPYTILGQDLSNPSDLLVHYTFEGNFNDQSGNDKHITPLGGAAAGMLGRDRFGFTGVACTLDGIDDHLKSDHEGLLQNWYRTISAWIKLSDDGAQRHTLIASREIDSRTGSTTYLGPVILYIKFQRGNLLYFDGDNHIEYPTSIPPNVWTHITLTANGSGTTKVYVNGDLFASKYSGAPDTDYWTSTELGIDFNQDYFKGSIDDFRFYDRELSAAKVQELYQLDRPDTTSNSSISLWNTKGGGIYYDDGHVEIGNVSAPTGYKLYVEEGLLTEKVKISMKDGSQWADFVFDDNYSLPSLSEVDSFIKSNGHLPDVPSAENMVVNGLDVVKINAKLLQKIEELTLYTIHQNEEISQLRERIELIESD